MQESQFQHGISVKHLSIYLSIKLLVSTSQNQALQTWDTTYDYDRGSTYDLSVVGWGGGEIAPRLQLPDLVEHFEGRTQLQSEPADDILATEEQEGAPVDFLRAKKCHVWTNGVCLIQGYIVTYFGNVSIIRYRYRKGLYLLYLSDASNINKSGWNVCKKGVSSNCILDTPQPC